MGESNDAALDMALVPSGNETHLVLIRDGGIERRLKTGLGCCGPHAWSHGGLVAVLTRRRGHQLLWWRVLLLQCDELGSAIVARLDTPIAAADLAWFDDRLVVCGISPTGPRAWLIAPLDSSARWLPLPMPQGERWERKGFDALVTQGRQLIAIDNFVIPKWMVRYEASANGIPTLAAVLPMAENGTYETVHCASDGDSVFAVLSTTVGRSGVRHHCTFYAWEDARPLRTLTLAGERPRFAMQGDDLWLLHGPSGARSVHRLRDVSEPRAFELDAGSAVAMADASATLVRSRDGRIILASGLPEGRVDVLS
ncbi:MAG: hypothetical protein GXC76_14190 [Rhodanobacteraceae bacterium]|jgi:hypothetical protein|nr:hypothetical protein [Rhodanobacteraceae bacterium]